MKFEKNMRHLVEHSGEAFDHWRARSLAALGVFTPLDTADDES
jgi:predicted MarR family transcription regulator